MAKHLFQFTWRLPEDHQHYEEVRFPTSFHSTPDLAGWYVSWEWNTENNKPLCYTGLQPRPKESTKPDEHTFLAIFSTFAKGAAVVDAINCHAGADNKTDGISCGIYKPSKLKLDTFYEQRVYYAPMGAELSRYIGRLYEKETDRYLGNIGAWDVLTNTVAGPIARWYIGFVEPYIIPATNDQAISFTLGRPIGVHEGQLYEGPDVEPYNVPAPGERAWDTTITKVEDGVRIDIVPNGTEGK